MHQAATPLKQEHCWSGDRIRLTRSASHFVAWPSLLGTHDVSASVQMFALLFWGHVEPSSSSGQAIIAQAEADQAAANRLDATLGKPAYYMWW